MAMYAGPQTVDYILRKPGIFSLVNQPDYFSEYDQWGVYYFETVMGRRMWKAVKTDRNRMEHRWITAINLEELRPLATIRFGGELDHLEEMSQSDLLKLNKAKAFCTEKPDRYPLHHAIEAGNITMVEALLRNGAEVNVKDGCGMTALHTAAKRGDERSVKLLCNNGADPALLDSSGSSALEVALDNGHHNLQQLMN